MSFVRDYMAYLAFPLLITLYSIVAPYTKVEESFNIQAIHDIIKYQLPITNTSAQFHEKYDHFSFPGAVPRTFVGALALAFPTWLLSSISSLVTIVNHQQFFARFLLGVFNAYALNRYTYILTKAYGRGVGYWFIALQASQFHVIYYASRTLPNMFAFGLTTIGFSELLATEYNRYGNIMRGITYFVFAGVIFRSEIAVLLLAEIVMLFSRRMISLLETFRRGLLSAAAAVICTFFIDSFFWQRPVWPELAGFFYNAIEGNSSDWGTSPYMHYFSTLLPRLLLNPVIYLVLIPRGYLGVATGRLIKNMVTPCLVFIAVYSFLPHKEARFIIYVVPQITAAAAIVADGTYRRAKTSGALSVANVVTYGLYASIVLSFVASLGMVGISSLNYPGGDALTELHAIMKQDSRSNTHTLNVHMDVLSCMTGVTHFLELPSLETKSGNSVNITYDKTEDAQLMDPEFWDKFDYALMEEPEKAIGKWEIASTVQAYAGMEFLRPGDGSSFAESLQRVYAANNLTKIEDGKEKVMESEDVKEKAQGRWEVDDEERRKREDHKARLMFKEMGVFGTYKLVRDMVRTVTGGYWVGPRMEGKIRILRKVREDYRF